ncbi:hypothetical protein DPMN_065526 [Dreissena polymorpha]|uniref:Uncharacterized protein n=1 Tax=Dreissena polymorpha TaxID=45954 RepID=A0A9D3YW25_DREPO|nr:hypothetical protein DPMN_065526 [Dreissena polymorpha]
MMGLSPIDVVVILAFVGGVTSLECWHCISDDCGSDPSNNYKAFKRPCSEQQSCQKVYFEMIEETDKGTFVHSSIVRGCASRCMSRDDFENCTHQLHTSRGCVRKDCCSDNDLCNSAHPLFEIPSYFNVKIIFIFLFCDML